MSRWKDHARITVAHCNRDPEVYNLSSEQGLEVLQARAHNKAVELWESRPKDQWSQTTVESITIVLAYGRKVDDLDPTETKS